MDAKLIEKMIIGLVLLVVLFKLVAVLVPVAQTSGNEINAAGLPLGSLFTGNGVVFVIIMAALVLAVVFYFLKGMKGKK